MPRSYGKARPPVWGMVGCIFHLRLQLGHIGNYLFLGKIVDFFDVFLFWEGFFVDWWKLLSFQLGWYVGKCCVFWVGKLLFFWVIGWKILSFQKRGHETSFQKNGGHFGDFAKFFEKQKWVNILSLVFQVVHVYRKCLFLGGKRVLFFIGALLFREGWLISGRWLNWKKWPHIFDWGRTFFFQVSLVGSEKKFPAFPIYRTNRVYT